MSSECYPESMYTWLTVYSFGFNDGISNPALDGLSVGNPGDDTVDPGVVLLGRPGDNQPGTTTPVQRPSWAKDGTFLAFRLLNQLVPEFNKYVDCCMLYHMLTA